MRRRAQELPLRVAFADIEKSGAETGNRRIVRVEQPSLRQQGMHERIVQRAYHRLAELRARHEKRVHVHSLRVKREIRRIHLLVVDRHDHQVDVGLRPHRVVRQTAAEDGREDRTVPFHLLDKPV